MPITKSSPTEIRILIADDAASSRDLLRSILEARYLIVEAEDGEQVLEKAGPFNPHLLILDLQMPKLDGYATAMALRAMQGFEQTPIIALTAALTQAAPTQIAESGFSAYLVKPVRPTRLRECVASLLSQTA